MRILFLEPYPTEGASSRYRVEQYIPYFRSKGIECIVRPFISSKFYHILYKEGHFLKKMLFFLQSSCKRLYDMCIALKCDIIFIHLEAFPIGPPLLEFILANILGKKIVYDLDDAIYLGFTSSANKFIKFLKWPSKIEKIIKLSKHVITCNEYLADYASKFNKNVTTIHTSLDTKNFIPKENQDRHQIIIGWIGSHTTAVYLDLLRDVLGELAKKHDFIFKIVGASCSFQIPGVSIINCEWSLSSDVESFQSLDIGVYPLPNNEWIKGKTGFKTVQYMAVGVPCVVSNFGSNREIIQDGLNGFLASTQDDWINKLSLLILDSNLRNRFAQAGRKTVEDRFSLRVSAPKILDVIKQVNK